LTRARKTNSLRKSKVPMRLARPMRTARKAIRREDQQPPADDEDGAKRKPRFERRIDNLTARNKELEERLAKLEKGGEPEKPDHRGGKPEEAATNDKPKLEDFDTYEDWIDARTDWLVDQKA
jgi:hypothetical protein